MNRRYSSIYIVILLASLVSCRINRPVISPAVNENTTAKNYIERYKDLAVKEMVRTGVPASITLAQGMVESDYGRSTLARQANNHFGIKCHNGWTGPGIRHHDDQRNECFRKYSDPEESFIDHSDFLRGGSRYAFLFSLPVTDYKGWSRGLKKAGYATNPQYADMLIRKIEENDLQYLDRLNTVAQAKAGTQPDVITIPKPDATEKAESLAKPQTAAEDIGETPVTPVIHDNFSIRINTPRVSENNHLQYLIIKDGDTPDMIEKEFQIFRWELQRFNDLGDDFTLMEGDIVYLQPKRDKAEPGKEKHVVMTGDTMHSISQQYGVKLRKLYEYNRMMEGGEVVAGQVIWLRKVKPAD